MGLVDHSNLTRLPSKVARRTQEPAEVAGHADLAVPERRNSSNPTGGTPASGPKVQIFSVCGSTTLREGFSPGFKTQESIGRPNRR